METKILLSGLFVLSFSFGASAQKVQPLSLDVFTNATALPTRPGQLFKPIHPGITVGTLFSYSKKPSHHYLWQTAKLGFFHHRFVQTGVQLYSEFHYSYRIKMTDIGVNFGAGYIHSFPATQIFVQKDGVYKSKTNWGKPEFMAGPSLELGQQIPREGQLPLRLFITYQFWLQTPFVNQYVPVLPNTALHLGVTLPLTRGSQTKPR